MADIAMTVALAKALGGGGGGGGGGVSDVKVDGTSVVTDGVANVPMADSTTPGAISLGDRWGIEWHVEGGGAKKGIAVIVPTYGNIKSGSSIWDFINVANQHNATFFGLAKAAGDSTQSASSNAVGTYTETAKSAISQMLNAPETITGSTPSITAKPGVQYICGEVSTIDITVPESGIIDVIFESGSTPAVLTVTPPTGMTMKWAGDFDPTSLEANTTYEINIMNGCLGVAGAWT